MPGRPKLGRGLFYHRDSEGRSELAPARYVSWAKREALRLGVTFTGEPETIEAMIARKAFQDNDLYLDYGVSGRSMDRQGYQAFFERSLTDYSVSHLFIPLRDRIARPDNPIDVVQIEIDLRQAGLTLVFQDDISYPILIGQQIDPVSVLRSLFDYSASGKFRRDLARKLTEAKVRLAEQGVSIGGEPPYGFRRWLCDSNSEPIRELETKEYVKRPGHHVIWLPTAENEIAVLEKMITQFKTMTIGQIAKALNAEGIPSPKAGRIRTRNNQEFQVSGLWTNNTVKSILTHPVLIAVMEYGKRASGDQMRFTPEGPRILDNRDYDDDRNLLCIINPPEQRILTPISGKPKAILEVAERNEILAKVTEQAKKLKGKARARGNSPNPLGGRVYDMNCGWLMYRYARRGKFCYTCGLYQNSEAKCCAHNTVNGLQATRLVLSAIRQQLFGGDRLQKLENRLRQLAANEFGKNPAKEKRTTIEQQLNELEKKLSSVTHNMAFADHDDLRNAMKQIYNTLRNERDRLRAELDSIPKSSANTDPEAEVALALGCLKQLSHLVSDNPNSSKQIANLFTQVNANLYLRFRVVMKGKQKLNVPSGGVLTFGNTPPPIQLYDGPTDRPIIKKMIAENRPVSPILGNGSSGSSPADPNVEWSANGQRLTRRCT
jgi:hypothetical protein